MKARKRWFERDHFKEAERQVRPMAERLAWCPPNVITFLGLILAIPACAAFRAGWTNLGLMFYAASLATDLLDGPVARVQNERMTDEERDREWGRILGKGKTALGTWFDPFVDKARYFPALFLLGWDRLWHPLILTGLALAALLTALRWRRFRGLAARLLAGLTSLRPPSKPAASARTPGSNKLGKHKVHVEAALIFTLVLLPRDPVSIALQHLLLVAATAGGLASLIGQLVTISEESKASA